MSDAKARYREEGPALRVDVVITHGKAAAMTAVGNGAGVVDVRRSW
jgi:hypothetical protein